ncbi:MAG: ATP-binding protein [Bacteroidia bacterium]|jgi:signal transduction histidine kinase
MYLKDLKTDRILLVIGIILYAAWGGIYRISLPWAFDPWPLRVLGLLLMFALLVFSFKSDFVRNNFTFLLYSLIYLVTMQQCYLVFLNNFASEFLLLFIVLIVTLNAYFKKPAHLIYYGLFSMVAIILTYFIPNKEPIVNFNFFIGSVMSINALIIPIFISRLKVTERLAQNIVEINNSKLELQKKSDELVRSNNDLQQFAYVASHDLQEPLRMVTSYVQLLEDRYKNKLDQDASEFIGYAVDGTKRMRALIQSLLEYSRVGKIRPFEKIDMNTLVEEVLLEMDQQVKEAQANVKVNVLPLVKGDRILIAQLMKNLISNALKFKEGNKRPEIVISGERSSDGFLFSVRDNGIGISKEYFEKIFVIFQRLHSKDKYPGTGMGLAICKKIVEQHGGKIWVESELDKGAVFYFTIK